MYNLCIYKARKRKAKEICSKKDLYMYKRIQNEEICILCLYKVKEIDISEARKTGQEEERGKGEMIEKREER